MTVGQSLRLRRLSPRGRAVIVAADYGAGAGAVRGLEAPVDVVKMSAAEGADGVVVSPGIVNQLAPELAQLAVILRIDTINRRDGPGGPARQFCDIEDAVSQGGDAVILRATFGAEYEGFEVEQLGRAAADGRRWGLPVIADALSLRMLPNQDDYTGRGTEELPSDIRLDIATATRCCVEVGACAIRTRYSGDVDSFRSIVAAAGRPILVSGGPQRDPDLTSTLTLVEEILEAGAAGVIFGRRIWQHPDPPGALRAICAMVHDDATVDEALEVSRA